MTKARRKTTHPSGEGAIYGMTFLILLSGWLMVMAVKGSSTPDVRMTHLLPLALMAFSCFFQWMILKLSGFKGDQVLPPLVLLLTGIGLLIQFRFGNLDFFDRTRASTYAYPLGLGSFLLILLLFRQGRHSILSGLGMPALLLSAATLGVILATGQRFRGAVFLAGQINPAEIIKLLLAIFLAGVITDFRKPLQQTVAGIPAPPLKSLILLGFLWAIPMALLILQRDLGMIILLNIVVLVLVFMATGRWGYLLVGSAAATLASYGGFQLFGHARLRFLAWQDPFTDPTGRGWQVLQSLSAMFSGGMWGSGLGSGAPTDVPIASSDFVYAAYAEELGFVGCILLMILYLLLFYRGYRIADQLRQPFAQTLAAALTTMLAVQTLLNIGGVTKAIPLTGIPLPLISQGGSSLVTSLIMLGLLIALSEPAQPRKRGTKPRKP